MVALWLPASLPALIFVLSCIDPPFLWTSEPRMPSCETMLRFIVRSLPRIELGSEGRNLSNGGVVVDRYFAGLDFRLDLHGPSFPPNFRASKLRPNRAPWQTRLRMPCRTEGG